MKNLIVEINKMRSLMNLEMLNESERVTYTDLLKMFQENNFKTNSFVTIGYVNSVDIPKRVFPSDANESYVRELIKSAEQNNLSQLEIDILEEIISSELWNKTKSGEILLKNKKPKRYFELDPKYSAIIEFKRFQFGWMDRQALAKNFSKMKDSEMELRKKYGFGGEETDYPEDDWRRKPKYKGVGLQTKTAEKDINKGSSYKDALGDFPLYGDLELDGSVRIDPRTNYQRMALRQNISSNMKSLNSDYFFIDSDGNLHQVTSKFVRFFSNLIKEKRESIAEELADDEREFVKQLKELTTKYISTQFLSDRIAYLTATVVDDKTNEKKPIYFYNLNLDVLQDFAINKEQLSKHINRYINV